MLPPSSAQSWDQSLGLYPECIVQDVKFAVGAGYGESKYISERILDFSGLKVCSVRLGLLSGSSKKGTWTAAEWFPALVKSSIALGGFPTAPGIASWIQIDLAAESILGMDNDRLPLIPLCEWFDRLMVKAENVQPEDLEIMPTLKMLDFFQSAVEASEISRNSGREGGEFGGLATLEIRSFTELSTLMKNISTLQIESVGKWVVYWKNIDFLKT